MKWSSELVEMEKEEVQGLSYRILPHLEVGKIRRNQQGTLRRSSLYSLSTVSSYRSGQS